MKGICIDKLRMFVFGFFIFSALFAKYAIAQQQFGSIRGKITNASKQSLPETFITISSSALIGGSPTKICREDGSYEFVGLLPGIYQVKVDREGFGIMIRDDIRVFAGIATLLDFSLTPDLSQAVTVVGDPLLIDAATTATAHIVPAEIMDGLPKPNSIITILTWTAGVGDDSIAYGSAAGNRFWLDGVDVSSPAGGILYAQYNPSWFEEAQVTGIGAPAEFSGFSGVIGNFVTRSGGNQFHGLLEGFFQNQNFVSSNTPDAAPDIPFHSYDVSAQLGGPLLQDKLWFFSGIQYPYTQTRPFDYDGVTTEKYPKFITKLTYKPNSNNTIQGFVHYNWHYLDGSGAGASTLPEATAILSCSESTWNATWISLLNISHRIHSSRNQNQEVDIPLCECDPQRGLFY